MMSGKCLDEVNDVRQTSTLQKEVSDTTTSVSAGVPRDLMQSHISSGHSTSRISTIKENHGSCLGETSLVNKITNTIAHIHNADTRLVASDPTPSYIQFTHLQMPTYTVSNQLPTAISSTLSTGACSRQMPTSSPSSFGTFITSYQRPSPILLMPIVQSGSRIKPVSPILFVPNQNSSILIPTDVATTLNSQGGISNSHGSSAPLTREQLPMSATADHNVNTSSNQWAAPISTAVCDSANAIVKNTDCTKQNEYEGNPKARPTCTAGKSNELNQTICTPSPAPTCTAGKSNELNQTICTASPAPTCTAGKSNELNQTICTASPAPTCTTGQSNELNRTICTPSPAPTCTAGKSNELNQTVCTPSPAPTCTAGKSNELNQTICTASPAPTCTTGKRNELNPSICTPSPAPICSSGKSNEMNLQCPFVRTTPRRLYNHSISSHFMESIEVNRNQKVFVEAEEIRKALHLNALANNFRQCPFCPFQSSANSDYRINLRYHLFVYHLASPRTGRGKIKCCHCSKQFQSDMLYRKHIRAKHSEKGFKFCPFCPSKVKHMHRTSHFVRAHGFTIVIPNGRSEGSLSKRNNTIIYNSRKINSIGPNKIKDEKNTPFESVEMNNLPRKSVAMTNLSKLPSVVQVKVESDEPMLNSNIETDETQFHGNVSTISLGNSADFRNATLADDSQTTLSTEIPQGRYHTCPLCSEVFNKEKDWKIHLIAKHESCIANNFMSLDGTRQAKSTPHESCLERRENTNSYGHTDVGEMVKRVHKCSNKGGSISDCQVPFKRCSTSKRRILDSSICEDGNLHKDSLEGRKNKRANRSTHCIGRFSYLFYKKKEVVSNVARMSKLDSHDQRQMQQLKCPFCKSRVLYRFRWNLYRHIMSRHLSLEPDYQSQKKKCPHCNDSFLVNEPFLLHMKTVHQFIDLNFCPQCPYVGTSLLRLYGHAVSTHLKKLRNVDVKQVFRSAEHIRYKLKTSQSVIDNQQCPFCTYTVPKNLHYQRNLQLHLFVSHLAPRRTIERKIKCCHCSQLFDSNILYRKHVRRDHYEKGFQYCPFCPCKAKCLSTHLVEAHGSMIVIPNYSRPPNVRSIQDIVGAHSIEAPPNTISHESMPSNFDIIPLKQTMDKSKSFSYCKDGKLSIEWQNLPGAGPSSSSKFNQDKQPVKHFKTCHSNSITSQITPTLHSIANQRSADLFTAADSSGPISKPSISSLFGNQNISDPQEQFLAPKTKLKISLSNSEGFQMMKRYAHNQHNTKECPYCDRSFFLEEMYEHFFTEHNEINTCMHCDTKLSYVGEIFEHTWLFHFKLSAQLLTTVKTRYYSPEALRLILRKALLHLQNSCETTLKQCPLCDFGCKRKIKLKKYMSYHLVLCHRASKRSPQNNIQCPHCTAMFNFEPAFRSHLEFDHNSLHTFHCPFCPFKCAAQRALLLHNITAIHGAQLLPELCLDVNAILREDVCVTPTDVKKVVKSLERQKSNLLAPRSSSGSFIKTKTETLNEDLYELCTDVEGLKYQAHPYELCSDLKSLEDQANPCELCTDEDQSMREPAPCSSLTLEDQSMRKPAPCSSLTLEDQSMREPAPCSSLTLEDQSMREPAPCSSLTPEAANSFPSTSLPEVIDVKVLEKQTDYPSPKMYFSTVKKSVPKCYPGKNSLNTLPACTSSKNYVETIEAPSNSVNVAAPEAYSKSCQVADSIGACFSGAKSTDSTKVIFLHEKNVHINSNGAGPFPTFGCQADKSQIRENNPNLSTINHFQRADDNQVNIGQNVSQITFPPEENYFSCPHCCKQFSTTKDLLDHLKTEHISCSLTDLWPSARFSLLELQQMSDETRLKTYDEKRGKTSFTKYCASSDVMSDKTHFRHRKMGSCESTSPLTDLFSDPGDLCSSETELSSLVTAPVASGAHVQSTSKCQNKDMTFKVEIDSPSSPCPIDFSLSKVEVDGPSPCPINIPLFKVEIDGPSPCPINIPLFDNMGKDCFTKSDIHSIIDEDVVVKSEFECSCDDFASVKSESDTYSICSHSLS